MACQRREGHQVTVDEGVASTKQGRQSSKVSPAGPTAAQISNASRYAGHLRRFRFIAGTGLLRACAKGVSPCRSVEEQELWRMGTGDNIKGTLKQARQGLWQR